MSHFVYKLGTYFSTRISSNNVFYMEISQGTLNMMGFRLRLSLHRNFFVSKITCWAFFWGQVIYPHHYKNTHFGNMNVFSHLSTKKPTKTPPPSKTPSAAETSPCRSARNFDWANRTFHRPRWGENPHKQPWSLHALDLPSERRTTCGSSNIKPGKKVC